VTWIVYWTTRRISSRCRDAGPTWRIVSGHEPRNAGRRSQAQAFQPGCRRRTGTCSRASGTCATIRTRHPKVTQVTDTIYRVTTRLVTRKASSLITCTVRSWNPSRRRHPGLQPAVRAVYLGRRPHHSPQVKISDSHMFRRAAWLVPLVRVSACAPARRIPTRAPTGDEIQCSGRPSSHC
jgi:hypothetical protein